MRRDLSVRPISSLAVSLIVLLVALIASDLFAHRTAETIDLVLAGGTVVGLATVAAVSQRAAHRRRSSRPPALLGSMQLALYLSPVILLSVIFPLATHRISDATVGGAPLDSLLLAASLTVPWLSQAVCLPLYRGIGDLTDRGDRVELEERLCRIWLVTYLQSLTVIAAFAVPVELATRWPARALGAYLVLCAIYVAYSQSLIIGIVGKRRVLWAVGWTLFAATLLIAPTLWFLPPLVGLVTQLVPLRKRLRAVLHPMALQWQDVASDLLRGFLLGSVLWCDKFFFFLRFGQHMPVTDVFVGLLPAILAYNYYFVRLAPTFDANVMRLRTAMERDSYRALGSTSRELGRVVEESIARTGLTGAVLGMVLIFVVGLISPHALALVATVTAASWLLMMTTVLCYMLDYIGERLRAQLISAAHLVACAVLFALLPEGTVTYGGLVGLEAVLFAVALRSCVTAWSSSEYALFWVHATAW